MIDKYPENNKPEVNNISKVMLLGGWVGEH